VLADGVLLLDADQLAHARGERPHAERAVDREHAVLHRPEQGIDARLLLEEHRRVSLGLLALAHFLADVRERLDASEEFAPVTAQQPAVLAQHLGLLASVSEDGDLHALGSSLVEQTATALALRTVDRVDTELAAHVLELTTDELLALAIDVHDAPVGADEQQALVHGVDDLLPEAGAQAVGGDECGDVGAAGLSCGGGQRAGGEGWLGGFGAGGAGHVRSGRSYPIVRRVQLCVAHCGATSCCEQRIEAAWERSESVALPLVLGGSGRGHAGHGSC
jgi:hypothetical protein